MFFNPCINIIFILSCSAIDILRQFEILTSSDDVGEIFLKKIVCKVIQREGGRTTELGIAAIKDI
jgi:hypothetical protein